MPSNSNRFQPVEQLTQKIDLQKRFPAAHGHAAAPAEIAPVFRNLLGHRLGSHKLAASAIPGVRVVTVAATKPAALQKQDKRSPGPSTAPIVS